MKAYTYRRRRLRQDSATRTRCPTIMADAAKSAREALIEMVAEADETLMENFFEAGTLTQEELVIGLATATRDAKIFPLVCASGLANIGAQPLMDAIARLPALARRAPVHRDRQRRDRDEDGRREGAVCRLRLEDGRRSVRRPHHDVPRLPGRA